jgi:ArsR family transcriptional regulator
VELLELACCSPMVRQPLSAEQARQLARAFKALGDPVRLRLLSLVASHAGGEACVCDLTGEFDVSQPTISHHLKVLREAGLLTSERRATWVYYKVQPAALEMLAQLLAAPAPGPVPVASPTVAHTPAGVAGPNT